MQTAVNPPAIDQYLYGYVFIELFHLANKYKIFQYLLENNKATAAQLSDALSLNGETLQRILINLTAVDILHCDNGSFSVDGRYAPLFDCRHDGYIGNFIHFIRNQGRAALQQLEGHLTNATLSRSPYDTLYDNPADSSNFTEAMWELSYSTGQGLAAYMPKDCGKIVDIGGGSGALATAFAKAGISEDITVFDLPAVQGDFKQKMQQHGLDGTVHFVGGDFFSDPLPAADTWLLSYVLSNWDETQIITLLRRIREKLSDNSRLIVFERLFADDGVKPFSTAVMHLNMMLQTRGSHRTGADYRRLFTLAGFSTVAIVNTPFDKQLLIASR